MIRILIFTIGFCSFVWLTYESVQFRQRIRTDLAQAYSEGQRIDPGFAGGAGKVLNFYYESVYRDLPHTLLPATILMVCSVVLLLSSRRPNT
jgi:hypothetical protein